MPTDRPTVVALPKAAGQPRAEVVAVLEEALALAKAGRIIGVGVAMVEPDYATATSMFIDRPASPLIAATAVLHHRAVHNHTYRDGDEKPWFEPEPPADA